MAGPSPRREGAGPASVGAAPRGGHSPIPNRAVLLKASENHIRVIAALPTMATMTRIARGNVPAGWYHVTHRTAGQIAMFRDDVDRTDFCRRLARIIEAQRWICHAFCLMPTHYHLLLEVGANTLQPGMQYLNGTYAQNFNRRHGRWGHLRGDRYSAKPVESDGHRLAAFRYIALNPVVAGLCESPCDWPWGSYRDCVGLDNRFTFVTHDVIREYFGTDPERAIQLLRELVEDLEPGSVPRRAA